MNAIDPVIYSEFTTASGHRLVIASLNSQASLNSLTLEMIKSLLNKLNECEKDPLTVALWLQGAGTKAFCAGGDIRKLYEAMLKNGRDKVSTYAQDFFVNEYTCDYRIHAYSKPIICWGSGIVMGGGIGLFAGSKIRVVTESTRLAMPEISIGLYPDVGASWFLSRMPKGIGRFIGLTAARMNAGDAMYTGLATHFIKSDLRGQILSTIQNTAFTMSTSENLKKLQTIFTTLQSKCNSEMPASEISKHLNFIEEANKFETAEQLSDHWKPLINSEDAWIKNAVVNFFRGSPTSAKVIFEQLKRAKDLKSIKEAFQMELALTLQFTLSNDFTEGVRALLIDKDNKPKWNPAKLNDVSSEMIEKFFSSPFPNGRNNPLSELPGNI